ncbi:hypothetical protein HYD54_03970 [Mycoplasmopsis bovis]|nr:hypothetical protein [Mycoplasmopsis bovis]QQH71944.1 hypothetical protein HYD54_03970 [Mycoplasmopsis bovis]
MLTRTKRNWRYTNEDEEELIDENLKAYQDENHILRWRETRYTANRTKNQGN